MAEQTGSLTFGIIKPDAVRADIGQAMKVARGARRLEMVAEVI